MTCDVAWHSFVLPPTTIICSSQFFFTDGQTGSCEILRWGRTYRGGAHLKMMKIPSDCHMTKGSRSTPPPHPPSFQFVKYPDMERVKIKEDSLLNVWYKLSVALNLLNVSLLPSSRKYFYLQNNIRAYFFINPMANKTIIWNIYPPANFFLWISSDWKGRVLLNIVKVWLIFRLYIIQGDS